MDPRERRTPDEQAALFRQEAARLRSEAAGNPESAEALLSSADQYDIWAADSEYCRMVADQQEESGEREDG